jgi:hypothetical protein
LTRVAADRIAVRQHRGLVGPVWVSIRSHRDIAELISVPARNTRSLIHRRRDCVTGARKHVRRDRGEIPRKRNSIFPAGT